MDNTAVGCVDILLDENVPCLRDNETGEIKETVAVEVRSRSFLKGFREDNGWKINWLQLPKDVKVVALMPEASKKLLEVYSYEWN